MILIRVYVCSHVKYTHNAQKASMAILVLLCYPMEYAPECGICCIYNKYTDRHR